jgi:diguanylate cyclase (GGDEF)-like protein
MPDDIFTTKKSPNRLLEKTMDKLSDDWLKIVQETTVAIHRRFVSEIEFKLILQDISTNLNCPLDGFQFQYSRNTPFGEIVLGPAKDIEATAISQHELSRDSEFFKIRAWYGVSQPYRVSKAIEALAELFRSYWKRPLRDDRSWLPSFQIPETKSLVMPTINHYISKNYQVYYFFCDLDKFKQVNETYGQNVGDRIILELSEIIDRVMRQSAICLHCSGDEFEFIIASPDPVDVTLLFYNLVTEIAKHDFKVGGIPISLSGGATKVTQSDFDLSSKQLRDRSEKVLKPTKDGKIRGQLTISNDQVKEADSVGDLTVAICLVKSTIGHKSPFSNIWLNTISAYSFRFGEKLLEAAPEELESLRKLIQWISPKSESTYASAAAASSITRYQKNVSPIDIVLSVAHGLYSYALSNGSLQIQGKELLLKFTSDFASAELQLTPDAKTLFEFPFENVNRDNQRNLGGPCFLKNSDQLWKECSRAILLVIGHQQVPFPRELFFDVITIDDRPTRGGGLPDFWATTLTHLISNIVLNPNVNGVYVLGPQQYAFRTIEWLKKVGGWAQLLPELTHNTGLTEQTIRQAALKLENQIFFIENEAELSGKLEQLLLPEITIDVLTEFPP